MFFILVSEQASSGGCPNWDLKHLQMANPDEHAGAVQYQKILETRLTFFVQTGLPVWSKEGMRKPYYISISAAVRVEGKCANPIAESLKWECNMNIKLPKYKERTRDRNDNPK